MLVYNTEVIQTSHLAFGHMERYKDMLFLPIWMTPSSRTEENALVILKHQCIHGLVPYDKYVREVLALLHGKTGYVRSVSRMTVMGSIRMVISPAMDHSGSAVYVPQLIVEKCVVPVIRNVEQLRHICCKSSAVQFHFWS